MASNGFVYDKWSAWHLDDPKQYSTEQIAAYCFVVDALNFCFWPNNRAGEFEYEHMTRNLEKVLKEDSEFFTCSRLKAVQEDWLRDRVFNGKKDFCLVDERARIIREVGEVVEERFGGKFVKFLE